MRITIGKHAGESVAEVVLKHADYCKWLLDKDDASGVLERMRVEAQRLISIFDSKPILGSCNGSGCAKRSVRFSAYRGNSELPHWWCETCSPYLAGASQGKLTIIKTYRDALDHVESTCGGTRGGYSEIIRAMAIAKGLPKRSGEKQIGDFFGP
jgi:hypothetical protein